MFYAVMVINLRCFVKMVYTFLSAFSSTSHEIKDACWSCAFNLRDCLSLGIVDSYGHIIVSKLDSHGKGLCFQYHLKILELEKMGGQGFASTQVNCQCLGYLLLLEDIFWWSHGIIFLREALRMHGADKFIAYGFDDDRTNGRLGT